MRSLLPILSALALVSACTRGPRPPDESAEPAREAEVHPAPAPAPPRETARPEAPGFDPSAPRVGGVTFRAPAPFANRPVTAPMRTAEYVVAGPTPEQSAVLAIHHFPGMGGSVEANLARWIGQFTQPDGRDSSEVAQIGSETVHGLAVARVDVTGTYAAMMPGAPAGALENQRLLGAIVQAPGGPVFFKLVGPAPVVESAHAAFDELVASVEPAQ